MRTYALKAAASKIYLKTKTPKAILFGAKHLHYINNKKRKIIAL